MGRVGGKVCFTLQKGLDSVSADPLSRLFSREAGRVHLPAGSGV